MYSKNNRSRKTLFLFLLGGMVVGAFASYYLAGYPYLAWLDFGQHFGLTNPATLSVGILSVTFGFDFRINIGGVIGLLLGVIAYKLSERL